MGQPLVSVIIPALNEEADIAGCVEAIGAQDYPLSAIEVLVVDGASVDATVGRRSTGRVGVRVPHFGAMSNPKARTSCSLNVGLRDAWGDVVVRIDARSRVQRDYVRVCVDVLE